MSSLTTCLKAHCVPKLRLLLLALAPCWTWAQSPVLPDAVGIQTHGGLVEVSLNTHTTATREQAWKVLTDFDHMADILPGLSLSEVIARDGAVLQIHQKGKASIGMISKSFDTQKQVTLEPERRILSHSESPDVRSSDSVTELLDTPEGLEIRYRLKVQLLNEALAGFAGRALRQQTADNFTRLLAAMATKPR